MQVHTAISYKAIGFWERMFQKSAKPAMAIFVFAIVYGFLDRFMLAGIFGMIFLAVLTLTNTESCRFYITQIAWNEAGNVTIAYLDYNKLKHLHTSFSDMVIGKDQRGRAPDLQTHLAIKCTKANVEIKQFATGEWTEAAIDQLLLSWPPPMNYDE